MNGEIMLNRIDFDWNDLIEMRPFSNYSNLESLIVTGNYFQNRNTKINSRIFQGLNKLTNLDISSNSIQTFSLQEGWSAPLKHLKRLSLEYGDITFINRETIGALPRLEILSLRFQKIRSISPMTFSTYEKLQELNLRGHSIQTINSSIFSGLTSSLEYLNLESDQQFSIANGAFANLTGIKELVLTYNMRPSGNISNWGVNMSFVEWA